MPTDTLRWKNGEPEKRNVINGNNHLNDCNDINVRSHLRKLTSVRSLHIIHGR